MTRKSYVDLDNSRSEEQTEVMRSIVRDGNCPFCINHLSRYHRHPLMMREKWIVTGSQWPYENTKTHILIISRRHLENFSQLHPEEWVELGEILKRMEIEWGPEGGAVCGRFGDTEFSAGSVKHLHFHFIVPDKDSPGFKPVRFKIGK